MKTTEMVANLMGAGHYSEPLEAACVQWQIVTAEEKAFFLGQVFVESNGFTSVMENLNYSAEGLLKTFGRHRISADDTQRYGRVPGRPANQFEIANRIYGGEWGAKNLGNTEEGDGYRFRGRGLKQITGRANYAACSQALFGDLRLLENPDLLTELPWAAMSAGWYWNWRNVGVVVPNLEKVTKAVNGGLNGLEERRAATAQAQKLFLE